MWCRDSSTDNLIWVLVMDFLSLDSRQVISEFIGFLAGEGLLWRVIDYTAQEHGVAF